MKNTFLKYIKLTLALVLFLQVGEVSGQNNLTMKTYGLIGAASSAYKLDGTALDGVFNTVVVDGTTVTSTYPLLQTSDITTIPTTVAGFGGVQAVFITGFNYSTYGSTITQAQADALIAYVKGGGILIGNIEGLTISTSGVYVLKYIGEALLCNSVSLSVTAANSSGISPVPAYHPGNGTLLLASGATSVPTTGTYSTVTGLPSANVVFSENPTATCSTVRALDFVIPAYPGSISSCGVNGMALLSGEAEGVLSATLTRGVNGQSNKNYAQLIYDFLYSPAAMNTRRAWSTIGTNKNATCPPAVSPVVCAAGTTAPTLSATSKTNVCPAITVNLTTGIVSSATPAGASPLWFTNNTHTGTAVADATLAPAGTYYAFYYDANANCYSPVSAAVTVTITNCCATLAPPTFN